MLISSDGAGGCSDKALCIFGDRIRTNFQANIKLSKLVHMYMCYMAGGRALYNF